MGLMMLSAGPGTTIVVSAIGPEAEAAIDAIAELVAASSTKKAPEALLEAPSRPDVSPVDRRSAARLEPEPGRPINLYFAGGTM